MVNIIVDIDCRILVFLDKNFKKTYPVAVGKKSTPSPLGNWIVVEKAINPGGPFGVRWMRLSVPWGGYGIHGTNNPKSIGRAVSNGCIRMYNKDVIEIYERTPIGSSVYIIGKAFNGRILKKGDMGTDVRKVQIMLKKLGYYNAKLDKVFGRVMEKAVIDFQKDKGLVQDGIIGVYTLNAIRKAYGKAI
ncbi:L,D-transpeptidase family protein [Thermosyntropha sp.]|uniref:L,D-transpeptidase family protein n=1 Tax=Thermosyntropha sp. TaxID=2740820 RepID=UPI0025E7F1CB|nr:L,D-transpeptidase family protein [Thermosyntropha sp.]